MVPGRLGWRRLFDLGGPGCDFLLSEIAHSAAEQLMLLLGCEIHDRPHAASEDGAPLGSSHGEGRHAFKVPVQIDFHAVASTWPGIRAG